MLGVHGSSAIAECKYLAVSGTRYGPCFMLSPGEKYPCSRPHLPGLDDPLDYRGPCEGQHGGGVRSEADVTQRIVSQYDSAGRPSKEGRPSSGPNALIPLPWLYIFNSYPH